MTDRIGRTRQVEQRTEGERERAKKKDLTQSKHQKRAKNHDDKNKKGREAALLVASLTFLFLFPWVLALFWHLESENGDKLGVVAQSTRNREGESKREREREGENMTDEAKQPRKETPKQHRKKEDCW